MEIPDVAEFSWLTPTLGVKEIQGLTDQLIEQTKKEFDAIVAIPAADRTFANTVLAIHDAEARWSTLSNNCTFPSYVSTDKEIREARYACILLVFLVWLIVVSSAANEKLEAVSVEQYTREDIYRALQEADAKFGSTLQPLEHRLLKKIMREFERNGFVSHI